MMFWMVKKIIICFLFCVVLNSCNDKVINEGEDRLNIGKYKTEYVIYWSPYSNDLYTIYSDDSIYTCSFQGTNFLLEKNNKEEILSTTAPIKIIKCELIQ